MLKLLRLLFLGHEHKYEIIDKIYITQNNKRIGTKWILKCAHCGKMTKFQSVDD